MKPQQAPVADPVPRWLQSTFRRSHLAGPNYEEIQGHLDAGAQLVIANCDNLFRCLGVFAADTPSDQVADADRRLREFVSFVHQRKARAGIHCGPIHATYRRQDLALRHLEWLQLGADGKPRFPASPEERDRGVCACWYGPYGDVLLQQVTTLAKQYDLDALCIRRVHQEPGHIDLPLQRTGSGVRVKVPKVDLHCLVVAETGE